MGFIDLQCEKFDDSAVRSFWQTVVAKGLQVVVLDYDTEVGSMSATEVDWISKSGLNVMGVRMNSLAASKRWDDLSELDLSDLEFEKLIFVDAKSYLEKFSASKPESIQISKLTVDGDAAQ